MRTSTALLLFMAAAVVMATEGKCFGQRNNPGLRTVREIINRPTVSPYLNLLTPQGYGLPNYQTLVRPALQQRQQNLQTQRQISQLQSAVIDNNLRDQRGDLASRPTGHATGFFYYSHFFPGMPGPGQRRR